MGIHRLVDQVAVKEGEEEQSQSQIVLNGNTIKPSTTAKLLGVVFDHELRWKGHVQQAVKGTTKVNTVLGGLRHLHPEQMRRLYDICRTGH